MRLCGGVKTPNPNNPNEGAENQIEGRGRKIFTSKKRNSGSDGSKV